MPLPVWLLRPTLSEGDEGPAVAYMQSLLPHSHDGDFGPITDQEVRSYQKSRGFVVTGIVDKETWDALESNMPPAAPQLPTSTIAAITYIVSASSIAEYPWLDRGVAPAGYMVGMALSFAQSYMRLERGHPAVINMSRANTGDEETDALAWYAETFDKLDMSNDRPGVDTLRHLYVLLIGLGMRESSGCHCEGRDMSADNVTSDTAEAGLFQTSYNAHACCPEFDHVMDDFEAGDAAGFEAIFSQGVNCSESDWECYGDGRGYDFQELCKTAPAFAVESCALTLRNLRQHYGPINRREAEVRREADTMLHAVQVYLQRG